MRFADDAIHFDKPIAGVGPGLTFGKVMSENLPGTRIGLIPCAAGGSPITKWKSGEWHDQTNSRPYDDAIKRAKIAMRDGTLKGILWHQGEGDSKEEAAPLYEQRLVEFISTIREELNTPDVPFIVGELGEFYIQENPHAKTVNDVLLRISQIAPNTASVHTKGLTALEDGVHFNAKSARELGRRFAEAMLEIGNK